MNHAKIATNERLQKLLAFLRSRSTVGGATSLEIAKEIGSMAPSTDVSALRHNGYDVQCEYSHRTEDGRKVYFYKLLMVGLIVPWWMLA